MHYDFRKIFCATALALVLGLAGTAQSYAQGIISLNDESGANDNADEIPDEISLFGDDSSEVLTPQKPVAKPIVQPKTASGNTGVKSAAALLNKAPSPLSLEDTKEQSAPAVKNIPAPAAPAPSPAAVSQPIMPLVSSGLDNHIIEDIDDDVFDQMSDLEKQTAILNLELRKEQVKSNIEALRKIQEKAKAEEEAKKEEEKRKTIEWEKEQERKVLQEKQKLKNLEVIYEKARQEKLLNAYKNKMLQDKQNYILEKAQTFNEIAALKKERQKLINDFKGRFVQLTRLADKATNEAIKVRDNYAKTISDLQTQISILRARLEASEKTNPFAEGENANNGVSAAAPEEEQIARLSDLYAIMEVRGKGENLSAKLINDSGIPFMVKVGTTLQTGHIIDEITPTYLRADKEGNKEYLYFSAGGVLDKEPVQNEELKVKVTDTSDNTPTSGVVSSQGIPGVASEMTIR